MKRIGERERVCEKARIGEIIKKQLDQFVGGWANGCYVEKSVFCELCLRQFDESWKIETAKRKSPKQRCLLGAASQRATTNTK